MSAAVNIEKLIKYASLYLGLDPRDENYVRNALMYMLGVDAPAAPWEGELPELPDVILGEILEECGGDRAVLGERIMDALLLRPSAFEKVFWDKYAQSPETATAWAYGYAICSDYVKKHAIDKNIRYFASNGLEITINLSKPEKDNRDLIKQIEVKSTSYPQCTICRENEGFERAGFSRRNMRTVSLTLAGEKWFWQYSPYAYFNEHGIAIAETHAPMKLDEKTVERLFDFVDIFPHYFIGNNAPLPRVGGSILMHDHFQGGGQVLPMQRVGYRKMLGSSRHSSVKVGVLDWFNSALRLEGDRREVAALAYEIASVWKDFSYPEGDIIPKTGETPHSTASCIARKAEGRYILDMILRNNRTDERYPDGIFHAHSEHHAIKKESIGLIEAMGLFILPARLKRQLAAVRDILEGKARLSDYGEDMQMFAPMIARLMKIPNTAEKRIADDLEATCAAILGDVAVFKHDKIGDMGWKKFFDEAGLAPL